MVYSCTGTLSYYQIELNVTLSETESSALTTVIIHMLNMEERCQIGNEEEISFYVIVDNLAMRMLVRFVCESTYERITR